VLAKLNAPKAMTRDGSMLIVMNAGTPDESGNEAMNVVRVPANGGEALVIGSTRNGGVPVAGSDLLFTLRPDVLGNPYGVRPPDEIERLTKVGNAYPRDSKKHPAASKPVTVAFIDAEPAFAVSGDDLFFFALPAAVNDAGPRDDNHLDVMRMPRAGGQATRVTSMKRGARRLFLTADAHNVYFPELDRLAKAPVAGGEASTVAKGVSPWAAVSDGEYVYFSDSSEGRGAIKRAHVGGGPVETLGTGAWSPAAMALDVTSVWFVAADAKNGAIYRVSKVGGRAEAIARGQKQPVGLVVDEDHVYWTNKAEGTVCRADK
jgi:hypothetical protein